MHDSNDFDLSSLTVGNEPFLHFQSNSAFHNNFETRLHDWFENSKKWSLVETDFYSQYEFNLLKATIPKNLQSLIDKKTISLIENKFKTVFNIESFDLVGVTAHKLVNEQRIGIHNDFINGEETHRLVIHINPDWHEENGGFLILFNSSEANDISKIINPINNSAFGFEISNHSHHAVSKIYDFSRYTVVYTFKKK